ncbi:MAG TPA: DegT/DnrJ/EryC1/StrS family aminotransferase [Bacteroidales bacterium]|nr:DegT/DnrJ/EryC1/StrS family aminotransferase [Bacteroidales bacterium]HRZ49951.1 DegT/DnrJ/EryC1/StrS family aminotransferase [Bacteroidales bacterium]
MKRIIPIFNPSVTPWVLFRSLWVRGAQASCEAWFRQHTGKKFVLVTASCRNALWLAYKAAGAEGEVITTPLICHSAVESALDAGLDLRFCDLASGSFLMDVSRIDTHINSKTNVIQATHHGGQMVDMKPLMEAAGKHGLLVIEDCAQAFSASLYGILAGTSGDISCFTLSKNCYGIGGGILATNSEDIYNKAAAMQQGWPRFQSKLLWYRIVRYMLETGRQYPLAAHAYEWIMARRKHKRARNPLLREHPVRRYRPAKLFSRLFVVQQQRFSALNKKTATHADSLNKALASGGLVSCTPMEQLSFPKMFFSHPLLNAKEAIPKLNEAGIEVRHLENKYGSPFQKRLEEMGMGNRLQGLENCVRYRWLYNRIVSLPMHHALRPYQISFMVLTLKELLREKDID